MKHTLYLISLSLLGLISLPSPAHAIPRPAQLPQLSASWSPFEDWNIQVSSPIVLGQTTIPTLGISTSKSFPLGTLFADSGWVSRFGLGLSAQAFAPLNFDRLYLGAALGLSHYTPLTDEHLIDYGIRYAPLYEIGLFSGSGQAGYQGVLGNLSLRSKLAKNTYSSLGVQAGWYFPFRGGEALFVIQPLLGVNINF